MIDPRPTHAMAAPDATAGIVALIEGSQILMRAPANWAPPGYDETDIRILEWIGSHHRDRRQAADLAA